MSPELDMELIIEDRFPAELPEEVEKNLLLVAREAVTNVRRHSGARHVRVRLAATEEEIQAEVSDDGQGFDPAKARGGVGLLVMKERAQELGGYLKVWSEPGSGTTVRFRKPRPF